MKKYKTLFASMILPTQMPKEKPVPMTFMKTPLKTVKNMIPKIFEPKICVVLVEEEELMSSKKRSK